MDTVMFLPISIIFLYLLIIVSKAFLEISRRAMQKHAGALIAFPAIDAGHHSHRSCSNADAGAVVELLVVKYTYNVKIQNEVVECPFCLFNVEEGDEIRELKCEHLFHRSCLDKWLMFARPATCPLCRGALAVPETAPTTANHFGDVDEENDDSLMILLSCLDVNGWFSWICETLREWFDSISCRAIWIQIEWFLSFQEQYLVRWRPSTGGWC